MKTRLKIFSLWVLCVLFSFNLTAQTVATGGTVTLAANSGNLVKTGYNFKGWNTAANDFGDNYAAGADYTANAAVTLYAKLEASPISITDTVFVEGLIPEIDDSASRQNNFDIINGVIESVGSQGGGIIKIPAGTYFIGPNLTSGAQNNPQQAILIRWSNITLCGAGMNKTTLKSNATFVKNAWDQKVLRTPQSGGRGNGLRIIGTGDKYKPIKNIVIKDLEFDGQAGHNGNYAFSYTEGLEKGWDMMHKGIAIGQFVDSLTIENIEIHNYRGEVIYVGGASLGKLHLKNVKSYGTNASCFNAHASEMLIENCEFGKDNGNTADDCRFWFEWAAGQSATVNQTNKVVFRNNKFRGGNTASALCQGDGKKSEWVFENNDVDSKGKDFLSIMGGVAGPIRIINNTINNVRHTFDCNVSGGGVQTQNWDNSNIYIEGNTITNAEAFMFFGVTGTNVQVRNNSFTGKSATKSHSVGWVGINWATKSPGIYENNIFENNTFTNCRYPQHRESYAGPILKECERPLFRNNTYILPMTKNITAAKLYSNRFTLTTSDPLIIPNYEEAEVLTAQAEVVAVFNVESYSDGQKVKVYGGAPGKVIKFATGQASYIVNSDMYLDEITDTLTFRYVKKAKLWMEESSNNHSVTGVNILPDKINVSQNQSVILKAHVIPAYAENIEVTWHSDNPSVASVNEKGEVKGLMPGTATITVTTKDGSFTATCLVSCFTPITCTKPLQTDESGPGCDGVAKIIFDTTAISGGTGNYAYSLTYKITGINKITDVEVAEPLFGSTTIQASNEFSVPNAYGTAIFYGTVHDITDPSLFTDIVTYGGNISVVSYLPFQLAIAKLETSNNNDGTGTISLTMKGGSGGTFNKYNNKKLDNQYYYYTVKKGNDIVNGLDAVRFETDNSDTASFNVPVNESLTVIVKDEKGCEVSREVKISPTGINNTELVKNVIVYPNPTIGLVQVNFSHIPERNTTIRIFNNVGQMIINKEALSLTNQIDLSGYPSGIYTVVAGNTATKIFKK